MSLKQQKAPVFTGALAFVASTRTTMQPSFAGISVQSSRDNTGNVASQKLELVTRYNCFVRLDDAEYIRLLEVNG